MAFFSLEVNSSDYKTDEQLKAHFNTYCNWCWGHGYGNCDACHKYYNHLRYLVKMREFKAKKVLEKRQ